jgi:hypothetical protein
MPKYIFAQDFAKRVWFGFLTSTKTTVAIDLAIKCGEEIVQTVFRLMFKIYFSQPADLLFDQSQIA